MCSVRVRVGYGLLVARDRQVRVSGRGSAAPAARASTRRRPGWGPIPGRERGVSSHLRRASQGVMPLGTFHPCAQGHARSWAMNGLWRAFIAGCSARGLAHLSKNKVPSRKTKCMKRTMPTLPRPGHPAAVAATPLEWALRPPSVRPPSCWEGQKEAACSASALQRRLLLQREDSRQGQVVLP